MKKEIETESKSQETPIIIIKGFAKADGYALTDWDVLRRNLKKLHLLSERFGYRAISPRREGKEGSRNGRRNCKAATGRYSQKTCSTTY